MHMVCLAVHIVVQSSRERVKNRCGTGSTRQTVLGIQQIFHWMKKKINLNSAVVVVGGHGGGVSRGETRKGIAMLKSKIKY